MTSVLSWCRTVRGYGRARREEGRQSVASAVLLTFLLICALADIGHTGVVLGPLGTVVGLAGALVPAVVLVLALLWLGRWRWPRPRLLVIAFLWGAGFAGLAALLTEDLLSSAAEAYLGSARAQSIGLPVIAGVVEETLKVAFVIGMLIFHRRRFDGLVDGIVYAGMVGVGFAMTENVAFMGDIFLEATRRYAGRTGHVITVLAFVFLARGVFGAFVHPLFTALTGIGAGLASRTRTAVIGVVAVLIGYLLSMAFHSAWDLAGFNAALALPVAGYAVGPTFLIVVVVGLWQRRSDRGIVRDQLPELARDGLIPSTEIPRLSSLHGRRRWRREVRRSSGRAAAKTLTTYQIAVTELAFLRARKVRAAAGDSASQWFHEEAEMVLGTRAGGH